MSASILWIVGQRFAIKIDRLLRIPGLQIRIGLVALDLGPLKIYVFLLSFGEDF